MSLRLYVPQDMAARAMGADKTAANLMAAAKAQGLDVHLIRNGSRGYFTVEPLVELDLGQGRIAYGPVTPECVAGLVADGFFEGRAQTLRLGPVEQIPFLKRQTRLTFARAGLSDPLDLASYRQGGGFKGFERALSLGQAATVAEVKASGLRGRGGAGFPTGIKWETVRTAAASQKYIVCNADEGDSGTFADRLVMESDPFVLIEGMMIAGFAVGASKGYIYCRSEYPFAIDILNRAIAVLESEDLLGATATPFAFDLEVRVGAGAYVCGEETALLESLEGRRGQVRAKPPLPALHGLFGQPTVINNVLSLAATPFILAEGSGAYQDFGVDRSRGTMPVQLAGDIAHGGVFETPFGLSLGDLVEEIGGGTESGRPVRAVQVGGPLGAYFPKRLFDTPFDYEAFTARGGLIGHGGVVVFNDTVDMARQARFAFEFCAIESCGKCTPCRIGSTRGVETLDSLLAGQGSQATLGLIADLSETMKFGSLCALGGFTPYPVMSALEHFPEDFHRHLPAAAEKLTWA